ncbi:uncharacterized protein G2W53_043990 [Senna tora]|uniref:Uncharacterized protein n=1 Tax=Senna tora TaxID=362788 RepID=A0A834SJK1_9FABA|nr:uncharacterized protein G2W53_043990 [Senna tora]
MAASSNESRQLAKVASEGFSLVKDRTGRSQRRSYSTHYHLHYHYHPTHIQTCVHHPHQHNLSLIAFKQLTSMEALLFLPIPPQIPHHFQTCTKPN